PAEAFASDQQLAAALERIADVALDLLDGGLFDEGAYACLLIEPVADLELRHGVDEVRDEVVVDAVLHEDPVRRDARLPAVSVLADQRPGDGGVEVGVVEDDERRVAAELERDLLHLLGALRHEQLSDFRRAGEAELADDGVAR